MKNTGNRRFGGSPKKKSPVSEKCHELYPTLSQPITSMRGMEFGNLLPAGEGK